MFQDDMLYNQSRQRAGWRRPEPKHADATHDEGQPGWSYGGMIGGATVGLNYGIVFLETQNHVNTCHYAAAAKCSRCAGHRCRHNQEEPSTPHAATCR
jgi:hypothetical protein